ncbi:2-dehydropantoate 2-reductase [Pedobacter sp. AK017]|uniref:ketopantoate reductase family protein n=1 Tax=Pedobacter sp. AK017 TaxID=2723073 RepID=UPI0018070020|nr:2-dehydropantoate 2-reductase [Pedobacter sp. AK017]MBB5438341.1 2-dehydropantoate 2-reductase [Pedobacter sp. AK017]
MIYIVGTGVIGKSLATFLKLAGKPVTLIRASVDDLPASVEAIRLRLPQDVELTAEVSVQTFSQLEDIDGPVLVASKAFGNKNVAAKLASKNSDFPVMLLQNGLNVEQPFLDHGFTQVYRCVLMVTSQFTDQGFISFKPVASCPVGVIAGGPGQLDEVLQQLQNPWFPFYLENEILPLIWKKAIANCVFNSICPLLDVDNGIFYRSDQALELADRIILECIGVAKLSGISLNRHEIRTMLLSISQRSEGQLISTLQDIRNGRRTEIEMLNLEILRLAREFNMEHLVRETRILGELIDIKSRL